MTNEQDMNNGKLDTSIGIWKVPFVNVEIEYTVKDFRKLRKLMFKQRNDKSELFDNLSDYLALELIPKYHPDIDKVETIKQVEFNIMKIFENVMLTFNFTTKDKMDKMEREALKNIKEAV